MSVDDPGLVGKPSDKVSVGGGVPVASAAMAQVTATGKEAPVPQKGMGLALRLGTEMVSATVIGVGIGYFLDKWLETHPWMTLLFFLFGSAAGFRNMYRVANSDSPQQA